MFQKRIAKQSFQEELEKTLKNNIFANKNENYYSSDTKIILVRKV